MKTCRIPLRVVFYRQEGRVIAHCLEFDLLGDGETPVKALEQLSEAIRVQVEFSIEAGNVDNLFQPAEKKFFRMFSQGRAIAVGELSFQQDGVVIEHAETREYEGDLVPA